MSFNENESLFRAIANSYCISFRLWIINWNLQQWKIRKFWNYLFCSLWYICWWNWYTDSIFKYDSDAEILICIIIFIILVVIPFFGKFWMYFHRHFESFGVLQFLYNFYSFLIYFGCFQEARYKFLLRWKIFQFWPISPRNHCPK